ncbi:MaoC/PaaZ C-terminal domain-containing protein [Pseudoalteromonas piscicida]|uniref:MaoC/PaaZ C-terminal domain-containing protein n=1 Tax=Pseudoalteromonas piscicida TaxID=43662 RepID=UPI000E35B4E3|nr:MaoC/PaaZ C-terminal domain-containing protein [Pseudoalteromonas piscicida]AXQ99542.1 hypothetical protein D0N37_18675 [Pseudoalteromonas piscicida]
MSLKIELNRIDEDGDLTFIGFSDWLEISQTMVDQFADVTRDHQWIHTDPSRAASESSYGGTIVHGFFALSLIPFLTQAIRETHPFFSSAKTRLNLGANNLRFLHPIKVGAEIRVALFVVKSEKYRKFENITLRASIEINEANLIKACEVDLIERAYF